MAQVSSLSTIHVFKASHSSFTEGASALEKKGWGTTHGTGPAPTVAKRHLRMEGHNSSLAVASMIPHSRTSCDSNRMDSLLGRTMGVPRLGSQQP